MTQFEEMLILLRAIEARLERIESAVVRQLVVNIGLSRVAMNQEAYTSEAQAQQFWPEEFPELGDNLPSAPKRRR